jgi:hypothetical protein
LVAGGGTRFFGGFFDSLGLGPYSVDRSNFRMGALSDADVLEASRLLKNFFGRGAGGGAVLSLLWPYNPLVPKDPYSVGFSSSKLKELECDPLQSPPNCMYRGLLPFMSVVSKAAKC